jgi:hypothetical protein
MNQIVSESDCPLESNFYNYLVNTNTANYPSAFYANILLNQHNILDRLNLSREEQMSAISESMLMVTFYLNELGYKYNSQDPTMYSKLIFKRWIGWTFFGSEYNFVY